MDSTVAQAFISLHGLHAEKKTNKSYSIELYTFFTRAQNVQELPDHIHEWQILEA
jgi:hypothetical protein